MLFMAPTVFNAYCEADNTSDEARKTLIGVFYGCTPSAILTLVYLFRFLFNIKKGEVFCSVEAAEKLIKRGFGKYLGINIRECQGKRVSGELLLNNNKVCASQQGKQEIVPENENVKAESYVFHLRDGKYRDIVLMAMFHEEDKEV